MLIIETQIFTKRVVEILSDDEYRKLQLYLYEHPEAGKLIQGSRGLRKLRWTITGKGKRGGTRIIYYLMTQKEAILLVFIFRKNERSNLTRSQVMRLRAIILQELQ